MKWLFIIGFFLAGCKLGLSPKLPDSPALVVSEAGEVKLSGDAKTPGKANVKKSGGILRLPEASQFVFNKQTGITTLTLSKESEIALNRTETAIEGPVAFDPPKQPTAGELAEAKADYWTILGLRVCVAIGAFGLIFGLVKDWNFVMYGGIAVTGAGLFGLFVQRHPLLLSVIGLGVALAIAGPWIWHTKLKHYAGKQPNES